MRIEQANLSVNTLNIYHKQTYYINNNNDRELTINFRDNNQGSIWFKDGKYFISLSSTLIIRTL